MEKELIILVGPVGSGKSTYCKEKLKDYFRISQDEMGKGQHLIEYYNALERDEPKIVVDRMNFNKQQRERYIKPAKEKGYKITCVLFDISDKVCLERIKNRENHPNLTYEKAPQVLAFYRESFEYPLEKEGFDYFSLVTVLLDGVNNE